MMSEEEVRAHNNEVLARMAFQRDLRELINRHSMERFSNTQDFLLADYLMRCLEAFESVIKERKRLSREYGGE
jgi:hypothetical protein